MCNYNGIKPIYTEDDKDEMRRVYLRTMMNEELIYSILTREEIEAIYEVVKKYKHLYQGIEMYDDLEEPKADSDEWKF